MNHGGVKITNEISILDILDIIENPTKSSAFEDVKNLLEKAKSYFEADAIRFRLRDWEDRSVVYVSDWLIGTYSFKNYPELGKRKYFDYNDKKVYDCSTGLAARIARIKEEGYKSEGKKDSELIKTLKNGFEEFINTEIFTFKDSDRIGKCKQFSDNIKDKIKDLEEKKVLLDDYKKDIDKKSDLDNDSFFEEVEKNNLPWYNSDQKNEQEWEIEFYKNKGRKGVELFKERVNDVYQYYNTLSDNYREYFDSWKKVKYGFALPVVAFGKFIGVLNFHYNSNERIPKIEDIKLPAKIFASLLGVRYIKWKAELFESFQEEPMLVTSERNFEKITQTLSKAIREGFEDIISGKCLFPLLYIPRKKPIRKTDENRIIDEKFDKIWKNSYQRRREPDRRDSVDHNLWQTEKDLGEIPIRSNGLGRDVVDDFLDKVSYASGFEESNLRIKDFFRVIQDVEDPTGIGSSSARENGIKTTGCLPLILNDRLYGLLYLHCKEKHFFTEVELDALEIFGTQAAIAIHNADMAGDSYEKLYGTKIIDLLMKEFQLCKLHDTIDKRLYKWCLDIWGSRGQSIEDITIDTIKNISKDLELPDHFCKMYIKKYKEQEGALQSIENYRDHFIHPFHVFCLGYLILSKSEIIRQLIINKDTTYWITAGLLDEEKIEYLIKNWFITAIYHDIGYPAEKLEKLVGTYFKENLGKKVKSQFDWISVLYTNNNIEHINTLSKLYAEKFGDINLENTQKFENWFNHKLLNDHDHGVLSSLMLFHKKTEWRENELPYEPALAIALHGLDVSDEENQWIDRLSCKDFPLAFLLKFCDTAQEWGRKILLENRKFEAENRLYSLKVNENLIKIVIKYSFDGPDTVHKNESLNIVFNNVGEKFKSSWCLKDLKIRFEIGGKGKDRYSLGSFGPSECP